MFAHDPPDGSRGDKLVQAFFTGVLFVMATVFTGLAIGTVNSFRWPAIPCVSMASGVVSMRGDIPYTVRVHYQYDWKGQSFPGHIYQRDFGETSDLAEAERIAR